MERLLLKVLSKAKESWIAETTMANNKLLKESLSKYFTNKQKELRSNLDEVIKKSMNDI
jgi:hypothetical protein